MTNEERAAHVADAIQKFTIDARMQGEDAATIIGDMISDILHYLALKHDRETALDAARSALSNFICEQSGGEDDLGPEVYVLITARCEGSLWVSETSHQAKIKPAA